MPALSVLLLFVWPSLLMVVLLDQPFGVHGFADILTTRSNCWTELTPEEVIMNALIVPAVESDDLLMHIELVATSSSSSLEDSSSGSKSYSLVAADPGTVSILLKDDSLLASVFPIEIPLRLVTTKERTDPDYQFVMDIVSTNKSDLGDPKKEGAASFLNGACDGHSRVVGRGTKEIVTLIIRQQPTQAGERIAVVAAWAAGHEAVRLTPTLTFIFAQATTTTTEGIVAAAAGADAENLEVEFDHDIPHHHEPPEVEEEGNNAAIDAKMARGEILHEGYGDENQDEEESQEEDVDPSKALNEDARMHHTHHDPNKNVEFREQRKKLRQARDNAQDHQREEKLPINKKKEKKPNIHNEREAAHDLARDRLLQNRLYHHNNENAPGERHGADVPKRDVQPNQPDEGNNENSDRSGRYHHLLHYDIGFHHHGGLVSVYSYIKGALFLLMVPLGAVYIMLMCSSSHGAAASKGKREL